MKLINFNNAKLLINLILILVVLTGCGRKGNFAIQNCMGEKAKIIVELRRESVEIVPELTNKLIGRRITFELEHNDKKEIFRTNFQELERGLPIDKLIIKRSNDSTIFYYGAEILPYLDTDVIGEIACCPFVICM